MSKITQSEFASRDVKKMLDRTTATLKTAISQLPSVADFNYKKDKEEIKKIKKTIKILRDKIELLQLRIDKELEKIT